MIINTHKKGFTLVEMVVSMGIFSIVMVVAMGAFLKITEVNKRAQNVKNAVNNVNFTLEAISRELRTGKNYTLNGPGQITFLAGVNSSGVDQYYSYKISQNASGRGSIQKGIGTTASVPSNVFADATASNVDIKTLRFALTSDDYDRITIQVGGEAGSIDRLKTTFDVQTTVSQRLRD
jgi:prepilin-type N-terminal cleavage/methylation domain-containing protein